MRKAGIKTSVHFCEKLLEDTGVAILPGSAFGRSSDEFTARIAYVDFDGARALLASEAVPADQPLDEGFLESHCGDMLVAANEIATWLESFRNPSLSSRS